MPKYGKIGVGSCALVLGKNVKKHRDSAGGLTPVFIPETGIAACRLASHEERPAWWLGKDGALPTNDCCKIKRALARNVPPALHLRWESKSGSLWNLVVPRAWKPWKDGSMAWAQWGCRVMRCGWAN